MADEQMPPMSEPQARKELAAIRRQLDRLQQRWKASYAEQCALQQRSDAITGALNQQRLQRWVGQPVMLASTPEDHEVKVVKPRRGQVGTLIKVNRTRALVDFGTLGQWHVPIIGLKSLEELTNEDIVHEAEPVPGWRNGDELLDLEDEDS
jgi:hypothetical protein